MGKKKSNINKNTGFRRANYHEIHEEGTRSQKEKRENVTRIYSLKPLISTRTQKHNSRASYSLTEALK